MEILLQLLHWLGVLVAVASCALFLVILVDLTLAIVRASRAASQDRT